MSALTIRYEGHRATITLTQPEVRNAFSDEVIADITHAFHAVGKRSDVRAVVLAAEGWVLRPLERRLGAWRA